MQIDQLNHNVIQFPEIKVEQKREVILNAVSIKQHEECDMKKILPFPSNQLQDSTSSHFLYILT